MRMCSKCGLAWSSYQFSTSDHACAKGRLATVAFHSRWTWIFAKNGHNAQILSKRPPCCFNNKLPDIHCLLTYIMYDARNLPYKHYSILGDPGATSLDDVIFWARKFTLRAEEPLGFYSLTDQFRNQLGTKIFLCPIRVQQFSCYFRDFLFEGVHYKLFAILVRLVQDSFPRSRSATERRTMKPKRSPNLACL